MVILAGGLCALGLGGMYDLESFLDGITQQVDFALFMYEDLQKTNDNIASGFSSDCTSSFWKLIREEGF